MNNAPLALDNDLCDKAIRADFLHFVADPDTSQQALETIEDGLLILKQGRITALGKSRDWLDQLPDGVEYFDYSGRLIMPGFFDTHTHYPQTGMIASYGTQLLDWLEKYTFPTESKFSDRELADNSAEFFCQELLRNGTTTAGVFATIHPQSVDAIFGAAQKRDMCLVSGKVMMDRNAPAFIRDSAESSYQDSVALIQRWHQKGRARYAVTPRFAPTSSEQQLEVAGQLLREFPELYLQSHVAENQDEVAWVAKLFPQRRSYLDVYDHYGLLGERSIYAHCIHLDETDRRRMSESGAAIAFCPTSNLFLGSGLFSIDETRRHDIRLGIATDVGGGTSFSILQTLNEAYKVCQLAGQSLSPTKAFYLATLGGARSMYLDAQLGNFEVGKEADFVVLDLQATPIMKRRMAQAESIEDQLFALMMLGDDRCVVATHIMGQCQYSRS
ncbi:MAG: guanine deaminase [Gammaproteobacteria bacterium]|nr:guanine deaminase [Gammaproteobacteria bacterium]